MLIENVMYFVLGALAAGLVALVIMPAVWRRAVRLTKKRIEAATPMTMAEFRADKDQLRAEFALSTRRLELNVEQLRKRLAEQLSDVSRKQADVAGLRAEREKHAAIVTELEEREAELRERVLELEKEGADLAQRLRMREREVSHRTDELAELRETLRGNLPADLDFDGLVLSGEYDQDVDRLTAALLAEHKRALFLEDQAKSLIGRIEAADRRSGQANAAMAEMREALARRETREEDDTRDLIAAEARIASAENRLNALLAETSQMVEQSADRAEQLLAEKLSLEEQIEALRGKTGSVERTIMADWDSERVEQAHLREKLNDIASEVSRLVYALETGASPNLVEESLFERVQRFADDEPPTIEAVAYGVPARPEPPARRPGRLSERMAALREIQGQP